MVVAVLPNTSQIPMDLTRTPWRWIHDIHRSPQIVEAILCLLYSILVMVICAQVPLFRGGASHAAVLKIQQHSMRDSVPVLPNRFVYHACV